MGSGAGCGLDEHLQVVFRAKREEGSVSFLVFVDVVYVWG